MTDSLNVVRNGRVLEVTLNRPKANAIDNATSRALGDAFAEYRDDPDLRCAILTGAGDRFFSAGWDLKAANEGEVDASDFGVGGFAGITEMHDLNKPVIAALNGMAVGGGFELALCCDMILAAEHAEVFLAEVLSGILADAGSYRLHRMIPHHIAMEMLMTGRRMGAEEAHKWGLVNEVLPADKLMERARELAESVANGPPLVYQAIKDIVRSTSAMTIPECYAYTASGACETYNRQQASDDMREGAAAFAEGRTPEWKGK